MAPLGVEETAPGSGEYTIKGVGSKSQVSHTFRSGTAAAVAFDVSHILALKVGIIKKEQKRGYNFSAASREFLNHLVDLETVRDKDQVPVAVKHLGKMLDVFLDKQASLFPFEEEPYDQRVIHSFRKFGNFYRDDGTFHQTPIDQVPGLQEIKEAHDSGALFVSRPRGRPPRTVQLNHQEEGPPDTDTNENAAASPRAATISGRRLRREKAPASAAAAAAAAHAHLTPLQVEGHVAVEAASGLLLPPPQLEGDVATTVAETASGHLPLLQIEGTVAAEGAEVASGHLLPPQREGNVATAVAEVASGHLPQPPHTGGDVQSVAEHGLGRGRGRRPGRGRGEGERGRGRGRSGGEGEGERGRGRGRGTGRSRGRGRPPKRPDSGPGRPPKLPDSGPGPGRPPKLPDSGPGRPPKLPDSGPGRGRGRGRPPKRTDSLVNQGEVGDMELFEESFLQRSGTYLPLSGAEEEENNTETGDVEEGRDIPEVPNVRKRKRNVKAKEIGSTSTSTRDEKEKGTATSSPNSRDEKGKGNASTSEKRSASGPHLILEVATQCDQHGVRISRHYHFAHDCVCKAVEDVVHCYQFWSHHPLQRSHYHDNELPSSFQEWKNSHPQV